MATKKKDLISATNQNNVKASDSALPVVQYAKKVVEEAGKKIKEGLDKPTASTGTPMDKLTGAAKITSTFSNIGGGSVDIGGKGMIEGINVVNQYAQAKAVLDAASAIEGKSVTDTRTSIEVTSIQKLDD